MDYHAADRLAHRHQVEALVDLVESKHVGDYRVDANLALHVPFDDFGHSVRLRASPNAMSRQWRLATSWNGNKSLVETGSLADFSRLRLCATFGGQGRE